jgi:hypothetical protein
MVQVPTSLACVNVGQMAYLYGGAAVEVTVALWGVDAIPTFFKNYVPTVNWETNWQRQFGITSEQFHTAMIPFFRSFADHLN